VKINPSSVIGGTKSSGVVYLTGGVVGPDGMRVDISSNDASFITIPRTVTIPAYDSSVNFDISTNPVSQYRYDYIGAYQYGTGATASIQLTTPPIDSVKINKPSVIGGSKSSGVVYLTGGVVGSQGMRVDLSSNDASFIKVPTSVMIPAFDSSVNFDISTNPVSQYRYDYIGAYQYGTGATGYIQLITPPVSSIQIKPTTMIGGTGATGTIYLSGGVVGPDGMTVDLSSNDPLFINIPKTVTIRAYDSSVNFDISTNPVSQYRYDYIGVYQYGTGATASIQLTTPPIASVKINPSSVIGGTKSSGVVYLAGGVVGPQGMTVDLSSNDASFITIPKTVTIPAYDSSVNFDISTNPVSQYRKDYIGAYQYGTGATGIFTLTTAPLSSMTINPTVVIGGTGSTGTVYLSGGVAGPQGTDISLSCITSPQILTLDSFVKILPYDTCANFRINTSAVSSNYLSNIIKATQYRTTDQNTNANNDVTSNLQITIPPLSSIKINPTTVVGGSDSFGTVYLTGGVAGIYAIQIDISYISTNLVNTSTSVNIPPGDFSATFTIKTSPVSISETNTIIASKYGLSVSGNITLVPPAISNMTISPPNMIAPSGTATGTIYLTGGSAGPNGILIDLSSSSSDVTIPSSVTILNKQSSINFSISCKPISSNRTVIITATSNGVVVSASVQLYIPTIKTFTIYPNQILGGTNSIGTITLKGNAGSPGIQLDLSTNTSNINIPSNVTVPTNNSSVDFPITTVPVDSINVYNISASINSFTRDTLTNTITLLPTSVQTFTISPHTVQGGTIIQGTITLTQPAPPTSNINVLLSSPDSTTINIPPFVTILANQSQTTFNMSTNPVANPTNVTITATFQLSIDASVNITTPNISSFSIQPGVFTGGVIAQGTITMDSTVTTGDILIDTSSSFSVLNKVTIPSGNNSASFDIPTNPVINEKSVSMNASFYQSHLTSNAVNLLPTITGITTNYSTVTINNVVNGKISLSGIVANTYSNIHISTDCTNGHLQNSKYVTIAVDQSSILYSLDTSGGDDFILPETYTISATFSSSVKTVPITIIPPIGRFYIYPHGQTSDNPHITGGYPARGFIGIYGPITIQLAASNHSISIPSTIDIPDGSYGANFDIKLNTLFTDVTVDIIATINGDTIIRTVYITPSILSLSVPTSTIGSVPTDGSVTIRGVATNPINIVMNTTSNVTLAAPMITPMISPMIADNGDSIITPFVDGGGTITLTVPSGSNQAQFTILTNAVQTQQNASISATLNQSSSSVSIALTVPPSSTYESNQVASYCRKHACDQMIIYNNIVTSANNPRVTKKQQYSTNMRTLTKIPVSYNNLLRSYICGTPGIPSIDKTVLFLYNNPQNVTVDSNGLIYVANKDEVIRMDKDGNNKFIVTSNFTNNLINITVYTNYLFITVYDYLIRVNTDGTNRIILPPSFTSVYGITSDPFGNIYVSETNSVIRMDINGGIFNRFTLDTVSGDTASGDTVSGVYAVEINNNNIYIIAQILKTTNSTSGSSSTFITNLYYFNISKYKYLKGSIVIPQNEINLINIVDNNGTPISLSSTVGFSVFDFNTIYISDADNNVVYSINSYGHLLNVYSSDTNNSFTFNAPRDIACDPTNQYLYVADSQNNRIIKIINSIEKETYINITNTIKQPHGIAVDNDQNCYIIDLDLPYVSLVEINGDIYNPIQLGSGLQEPGGIAIDTLNNYIYVCNTNGANIQRMNLTGLLNQITIDGNGLFQSPNAIAVDYMGNMVILDNIYDSITTINRPSIWKLLSYETIPTKLLDGTTLHPPFISPSGIAVDSDGNIYVSDLNRTFIYKLDPTGGFIGTIGNGFNTPYGLAIDTVNNIYVADNGNNRIVRMDINGNGMTSYYTGILAPYSVSVDINQNVYVITTNRIVKFRFPVNSIPAVCA
jgi:sugar lactone lactonase YvrE